MIKKTVSLIFFLIFTFYSLGDWKRDIASYFQKAHEYDRIIKYIEKNFKNIPDKEKPVAIIILCYAYNEVEDPVNEEKWIGLYFTTYKSSDLDFNFLYPQDRIKIYEFVNRWNRLYPNIKMIRINKDSRRISYFYAPKIFRLDIQTSAPSGIIIKNNQMETIYKGYLQHGLNTIELPLEKKIKRNRKNTFQMILKTGSIEIFKTIHLTASYEFPDPIEFDPVTGKIAIKGKKFQKEKTEEIVFETKRYFDKRFFLKKALLNLGIGSAIFAFNRLFIHNKINRDSLSEKTKALMNGLDKTSTVLSIGISMKGIINVFKSFKKTHERKVKTIIHEDAVSHNHHLREMIQASKKDIFISYFLKVQE